MRRVVINMTMTFEDAMKLVNEYKQHLEANPENIDEIEKQLFGNLDLETFSEDEQLKLMGEVQ